MKRKHMLPRILAIALAFVLTMNSMSLQAYASEVPGEVPAETEVVEVSETEAAEVESDVVEEEPTAEEAPVVEEESTVEEEPVAEEEPTVEEPSVEEEPTVEEEPSVEEEPTVEEPSVEEEPTVEEPSVEEEPTVEEPSVEEEPAVEEESAVEEETAAEEELTVQEIVSEEESEEEELLETAAKYPINTTRTPYDYKMLDGKDVQEKELYDLLESYFGETWDWWGAIGFYTLKSKTGDLTINSRVGTVDVVNDVVYEVLGYKRTGLFKTEPETRGYIRFRVYHLVDLSIIDMPLSESGEALGGVTLGKKNYNGNVAGITIYESDGALDFAVKQVPGYAAKYSIGDKEALIDGKIKLSIDVSGTLTVTYYEPSVFNFDVSGAGTVTVSGTAATDGSVLKPKFGDQIFVAEPEAGYWAKDFKVSPVNPESPVPEVAYTYENGKVTAAFNTGKEEYNVSVTFAKLPAFSGAASVVYDGQPHDLYVSETDGLTVLYVGDNGYSSEIAPVNAGTYTVKAVYDGYDPVNGTEIGTGSLVIKKRPINIEFTDMVGKVVGEPDPVYNVYGEQFTFVPADASLEGGALAGNDMPQVNLYRATGEESGAYAIAAELVPETECPVNANYELKNWDTVGVFYIGLYDLRKDYSFTLLDEEAGKELTAEYGMKYTGEEVMPVVVTVPVDSAEAIVKDTHYTVTYANNVKPGVQTAKVIVEGISESGVIGKVEIPFSITVVDPENLDENYDPDKVKVDLSDTDIESVSSTKIEAQTYTGKAIKPAIDVYHGTTKLVLNKDYTVAYKNNTNVYKFGEGSDPKKIPTVTVKGKGNYSGTQIIHFDIVEKNIADLAGQVTLTDSYVYNNGKAIKPVITIKNEKLTLKLGKDYTLTYDDPATPEQEELVFGAKTGKYTMIVKGIGNYTGEMKMTLSVADAKLEKAVSKLSISVKATSAGEAPVIVVKDGKKVLNAGVDYEVAFDSNRDGVEDYFNSGKQTVVISGKDKAELAKGEFEYVGSKSVVYTVKGAALSKKVNVTGFDAVRTYNAAEQKQKNAKLILKDASAILVEGVDYKVSYTNNIKVGTATAVFTGIGNYEGTLKKTFKISARNLFEGLEEGTVVFEMAQSAQFDKAGAKAEITELSYNGIPLAAGKDYTVTYKNNKKVSTETVKATVTIKGKGNYSGTLVKTFDVVPQDIAELDLVLPNVVTSPKKGGFKTAPILYDKMGKALALNKDYTITYYETSDAAYTEDAAKMISLTQVKEYEEGGNNTVYVRLEGAEAKGFAGARVEAYQILPEKISAAKVTVNGNFWYTGEEIKLSEGSMAEGNLKLAKAHNKLGLKVDCLTVTVGKGKTPLILGEDYEILDYTYRKNVNKGKASVMIRGIGSYTGVRTIQFNIVARPTWLDIFDKLSDKN